MISKLAMIKYSEDFDAGYELGIKIAEEKCANWKRNLGIAGLLGVGAAGGYVGAKTIPRIRKNIASVNTAMDKMPVAQRREFEEKVKRGDREATLQLMKMMKA